MKKIIVITLVVSFFLLIDNLSGYGPISFTETAILVGVLGLSYDSFVDNKKGR